MTTALGPAFLDASGPSTPLDWPGSANLLAWWHWFYERNFNSALRHTGASPNVTFSGTVPQGAGFVAKVTTGGVRGTAELSFSYDNGATYPYGPMLTAASMALSSVIPGNGMTLVAFAGTYVLNEVFELTYSDWPDQSGHSHDWISMDGTPAKSPVPKNTGIGTGLQFNGTTVEFRCITAFAATLLNGDDAKFYIIGVVVIDSAAPATNASYIWFGDGATGRGFLAYFSNTPLYKAFKQDNAGTLKIATQDAGPAPATGPQVMEIWSEDGKTFSMRISGTLVFSGKDLDVSTLTASVATLGGSFLGGAEGNKMACTWLELAAYTSGFVAATRDDLLSRYRAGYSGL